jgi:hypothetical protein
MADLSGFTIEQEQEYQRDKKVAKYLDNNSVIVSAYVPLDNKRVALNTKIGEVETLLGGKAQETKSVTSSKGNKKIAVGVFYESVCSVCRSFLLDQENDLAGNFNITKSKILHLADGEVKPLIIQINKWITDDLIPDPLFAPYGIVAGTLTTGLGLATAFDDSLGEADNIDAVKTAVSKDVAEKLEKIKEDVTRIDLLVRNFITTQPTFYNGFQAVKLIDDIGIHHTGMKGDVTKDGKPVRDAVIACAEINKSVKSNILGHYEIISMKSGTFEFTCTHPTFGTVTKIITVKKGRTIEVDWEF